jgi:hypothetical protein
MRRSNGLPFASLNGLYNLSRLSVWWLRLGNRHRAHQARPSADHRQSVRHEIVTHVLGTFCHPGLRAGQWTDWWAVTDSNRRHPACKADALPTELTALRREIYRRLPQLRKGPAPAALSETAVPD